MDQQEFQTLMLAFVDKTNEFMIKTNEQLARLQEDVRGLKEDMTGVKQTLWHIQERIDGLQKRDDEMSRKVEDIYHARNEVQIKFGWQWAFVSIVIAFSASGFSLFVAKIIES